MMTACSHSSTVRDPSREICIAVQRPREISRHQVHPRIYLKRSIRALSIFNNILFKTLIICDKNALNKKHLLFNRPKHLNELTNELESLNLTREIVPSKQESFLFSFVCLSIK